MSEPFVFCIPSGKKGRDGQMKKGGYKRGKKLAAQILICAALFCFLWMGQEEELPLGGKTAKAFHQKLTED